MTHIRTCSISSARARYPAEKVLLFRVFLASPVAHVCLALLVCLVPPLLQATIEDEN